MRQLVAAAALVALAACGGSGGKDEPASDDAATSSAAPDKASTDGKGADAAATKVVELTTAGLTAAGNTLNFEAARTDVEGAVQPLLGDPTDSGSMEECGAGAMDFTDYAGGLTLNFMDAKLVGWNWRSPQDGDAPAKGEITVAGSASLGTSRATVEGLPGFEMFADSTLGDEFQIGDALFGFFEAGKVSMLYSGTQCFFR